MVDYVESENLNPLDAVIKALRPYLKFGRPVESTSEIDILLDDVRLSREGFLADLASKAQTGLIDPEEAALTRHRANSPSGPYAAIKRDLNGIKAAMEEHEGY